MRQVVVCAQRYLTLFKILLHCTDCWIMNNAGTAGSVAELDVTEADSQQNLHWQGTRQQVTCSAEQAGHLSNMIMHRQRRRCTLCL